MLPVCSLMTLDGPIVIAYCRIAICLTHESLIHQWKALRFRFFGLSLVVFDIGLEIEVVWQQSSFDNIYRLIIISYALSRSG